MNCIEFPKIFKNNSTSVLTGNPASRTCIHLLLSSEQGELFGDPEFGIRLKRYTYEQNNYILRDIIIDEIFEKISKFCPQISVQRKDIKIEQQGKKLYANIKAINKLDFTTNMFNLVLFEGEER